MAIYQMMQDRQANALRTQALQQDMARNAMLMQNTEEDRRIAAAGRAEAARRAAEERRLQVEFMRDVQSGFTPAKNAIMGPGTIQGSTPAQFDPTAVKNRLLARGNVGGLKTYSDMLEQLAKQQEAEGKATGQGLTNIKTGAETQGINLANITKQFDIINAGVDRAVTPDAMYALYRAVPDALAARGQTPETAIKAFDDRVAELSKTLPLDQAFAQARMEVANGAMAVQKQLSETATAQKPELKNISGVGMTAVNPYTGEGKRVTIDGEPIPTTTSEVPELKKGEVWNAEKQRVDAAKGSDTYIAQSQKHGKDISAVKTMEESTKSVAATIDKILDPAKKDAFNSNFGTSTYFGSRYIPGETQDVGAAIETLKSQMKMAGASLVRARGGAVGAITEREWPYLESMIDTLTPNMTEGEARRVIQSVGERLKALNDVSKETYDATWGNTQYYKPGAGGGNKTDGATNGATNTPTSANNNDLPEDIRDIVNMYKTK